MEKTLNIQELIGKGYGNGWFTNCDARYRLFKGSRNSKKSFNLLGFEVLFKIMSDNRRNVVIIRNTNTSNRDSTFSSLLKLINKPNFKDDSISLNKYFKYNKQEMTITYIPTGQVIVFRGMDDVQKIQGLRAVHGEFSDIYIEEAFEIKDFQDFRVIDGTFREGLSWDNDLKVQITMCFNAWSIEHWLYEKFFKGRLEDDYNLLDDPNTTFVDYYNENEILEYGKGIYLHISTYKINEFRRKETYDLAMAKLKELAPEIYKVEALGMWGNAGENAYPEFSDKNIISHDEALKYDFVDYAIGIDTGYSNGEGKVILREDSKIRSATTMVLCGLTRDCEKVVVLNEYFYSNETQLVKKGMPEFMSELVALIKEWRDRTYRNHPDLMKNVIKVYVDCADQGTLASIPLEATKQSVYNIQFMGSTKKKIQTRVDFDRLLFAYGDLLIANNCENLIREYKHARKGTKGQARESGNDHTLDACDYAKTMFYPRIRLYKDFKEH